MTPFSDSKCQSSLSDLLVAAALDVTYFVAARLSLSMGAVGGVAAPVWPPTGLSLAALLILGSRLWPGVAAGAFLANWSAGVPMRSPKKGLVRHYRQILVDSYINVQGQVAGTGFVEYGDMTG